MRLFVSLIALSCIFAPTFAFSSTKASNLICPTQPSSLSSFSSKTTCYSHPDTQKNEMNTSTTNRRDFVSTLISAASVTTVTATTLIASPLPSVADVSDGNALPQGAAQFSRVIKVRAQLKSVAKRVSEQSSEISKEEWDKIDDFLRTVYSAGDDMKVIAKNSIFDPAKKKKAEEDISLLQKVAQAGQGPVSKKDAAGFGVVASKADNLFEDFLDLLRDVPDEL